MTVDLAVDLGFNIVFTGKYRLYGPDPEKPMGLNAPEVNTPEGKAAKAFLQGLLPAGTAVIVQTVKDRAEKYGRYLGVLWLGGKNVNQALLDSGHAVLKEY